MQKELNSFDQGANTISEFFTKSKSLWDELNSLRRVTVFTCGCVEKIVKYEEDQRLIHFMMGLNDVYAGVLRTILMMNPLPGMSHVYSLLSQDETQRS